MAKYILGIDEGTTGARAFVIDDQCEVLGLASAELTQHYPRPGWIEHDPVEILNVQLEVIRAALRQAKLQPSDLTAVALTNQRETGIVWEKDTGRPIHNAIVWASRQTVGVVEQWVEKGHGEMIEQRTGLIPDAYYTASKIRFILDAVPGAQERAERGELLAGTVDTWLIWNLTGRRSFVTEFSQASRTMMFNLETREWDDDLLAAYNIPKQMLANIVPSDTIVGDIGATFGADIPIASNLGDQQAGLFGQAAFAPGQSKMTYGTAGVLNINCGEQPQRVAGLTPSMAWGVQGTVAAGPIPPAMKGMFNALDQVNVQARAVSRYAETAEASGGQLTPGEMVQLNMKCSEFMFQAQLTSNIANRSSDGVQQLFKQQ